MTTEARILANRLNAQKSTGPQTPQGKAVVSQNALKHGLSARHDVITTESQADFDLHRSCLLAELDPLSPMESILADRIVSLSWRLKRADQIQNQAIDAMNEKNTTGPLANLAKSFGLKGLGLPQLDPADSNPDLIVGRIALKDFSNARVLDRLLMYERRIEHSLYKTTLELQRLRLLRTLEHPNATNVAAAAPPFSRRRHDDALTPNSTAHAGIPIHQEPISQIRRGGLNSQSSIVNVESPPTTGAHRQTTTTCIAQNKPNFQIPKTNANLFSARNYEQKTPPPHPKKQTQSNPIPASRDTIRDIQYDMPHTRQQAPSVSPGVFSDNSPMDTLTKPSYNAP